MIRASRMMLTVCAVAATALHGAGLWISGTRSAVMVEGGAGAEQAVLGASFSDMVAGAAQPVVEDHVVPNRQAERVVDPADPGAAIRPETPHKVTPESPPEVSESAPPDPDMAPEDPAEKVAETAPLDAAEPVEPEAVAESAPEIVAEPTPPPPEKTADAPDELAGRAAPSERAAVARTDPAVEAARPGVAAKPAQSDPAAPAPEVSEALPDARPEPAERRKTKADDTVKPNTVEEVVTAAPEKEGLQVSRRPQVRPESVEKAAARQSPEPEREAKVRADSGTNAARDATRGSATGKEDADAAETGRDTRSKSAERGNAAASNYPGMVMRHLSRVPRPRVNSRGTAVVRFRISGNGGLGGVSVARGSGSARLDRAALQVVRRAAPFPPPPSGAQRSFSIAIKGR